MLRQQYIQENTSLEGFVAPNDENEEEFKGLMEEFKLQKNKFNIEQEKIKQDNLQEKSDLLSKMNEIGRAHV